MKLFVVFATKRSGHHGVLNWLCAQHGCITHYNNAHHMTADKRLLQNVEPKAITTYGDAPQDILMNLEGFRFHNWTDEAWNTATPIADADKLQPILVIRRFRNWLASCACHPGNKCMLGNPEPAAIDRWTHMMGNYRNHLTAAEGGRTPFNNLIVIRFDDWFTQRDYRETLARQIGIPFTDAGINTVPRFASGSTFDQRKYDGAAQSMAVLDRWKQAQDNATYVRYMRYNKDLDIRAEAYFNAHT